MFRIGIIELGVTCGIIALAILLPIVIARGYAEMNKRLKKIEDEMGRKK